MKASTPHPVRTKHFIITIDTEGDNLWARKPNPGTRNASFLPRFQALCERHGFKPVYLTDYQMANDAPFVEFASDVLRRNTGEIGMHLHAWSTPGGSPLSEEDCSLHPYLVNFPEPIMREKIRVMTALLGEKFGRAMVSHRAGRWVIDERYVALLVESGYRVDCSVTPHVKWPALPNHDGTRKGADYRKFPEEAYVMDTARIDRAGNSGVLQVPMTVKPADDRWDDRLRAWAAPLSDRIGRFGPRPSWLRPTGRNLPSMLGLLKSAGEENRDYAEFMLHSSEFMPGGSPTFRDERSIEKLYADMEQLFARVQAAGYAGCTLEEYHTHWMMRSQKHG